MHAKMVMFAVEDAEQQICVYIPKDIQSCVLLTEHDKQTMMATREN
jgi:hypothetical protein